MVRVAAEPGRQVTVQAAFALRRAALVALADPDVDRQVGGEPLRDVAACSGGGRRDHPETEAGAAHAVALRQLLWRRRGPAAGRSAGGPRPVGGTQPRRCGPQIQGAATWRPPCPAPRLCSAPPAAGPDFLRAELPPGPGRCPARRRCQCRRGAALQAEPGQWLRRAQSPWRRVRFPPEAKAGGAYGLAAGQAKLRTVGRTRWIRRWVAWAGPAIALRAGALAVAGLHGRHAWLLGRRGEPTGGVFAFVPTTHCSDTAVAAASAPRAVEGGARK